MTGIIQDLRYALRQLGKNPGLSAVAVITQRWSPRVYCKRWNILTEQFEVLLVNAQQSVLSIIFVGARGVKRQ